MPKIISVKFHPNSSAQKIVETSDSTLEIYSHTQAIEGKANQKLIQLLSIHFDIAPSLITIIKGHKSKNKIIKIMD